MGNAEDGIVLLAVIAGAAWLGGRSSVPVGASVIGGIQKPLPSVFDKETSPALAGAAAPALEKDTAAPSIFTLEQDQFFQKQFWAMPVNVRVSYMGGDHENPARLESALAQGFPMPEMFEPYPFLSARPAATPPPVGKGPGGGFVYGGSVF